MSDERRATSDERAADCYLTLPRIPLQKGLYGVTANALGIA